VGDVLSKKVALSSVSTQLLAIIKHLSVVMANLLDNHFPICHGQVCTCAHVHMSIQV
jgi:hypothetical protein